jgi:hypothetical protein
MYKHFALYDTVPSLDDCPETLDNLPDNHPTDPCPPPYEEERMPKEWIIRYNDTHRNDD